MNERVVYATEDGGLAVIIPVPDCGLTVDEIAEKDVPTNVPFRIVGAHELPQDRMFREAWQFGETWINMEKAKDVAHGLRRTARAKEFAPFDDAIAKQIPGKFETAEAARVLIREKYAQMQVQIDASSSVEDLKSALNI
jgi:hypothetical protein